MPTTAQTQPHLSVKRDGRLHIRVRLTEAPHEYLKAGDVGLLEPCEMSIHGDIIWGRFYPIHGDPDDFIAHQLGDPDMTTRLPGGASVVGWPKFESV